MDDVIAVKVELADGAARYFLAFGRIQDHVDPEPVSALVLRNAGRFSLGGRPVAAQVCAHLSDVAKSPDAKSGTAHSLLDAWAQASGVDLVNSAGIPQEIRYRP